VVIQRSTRGSNNPIVALTKSITPTEKQECDKRRKKLDDEDASIYNNLEDDDTLDNVKTKVGVSKAIDINRIQAIRDSGYALRCFSVTKSTR
jgi:hypothetical protein